ncbi:hypothetical protein [Demequina sp.]|uniref:hypothetical protein n=1 Tax=Demequina sp. TaxID=2050685 RepID=UPI003D0C0257
MTEPAQTPAPVPGSSLLGISVFLAVIFGGVVGAVTQANGSETGGNGAGGFFMGAIATLLLMLPLVALFRLGTAILRELREQRREP